MRHRNQKHYDGLTSIPALMNRSYFCHHCDRAYDCEDASHHNGMGQNCPVCGRTRTGTEPGCPNFAAWLTPEVECELCHIRFYGSHCFQAHQQKGKKKGEKSLCERFRKCLNCCSEYQVDPKKPHKCFHATCPN